MKKSVLLLLILTVSATSCATKYVLSHSKKYEKYDNNLVSVATALNLAKNSYVLACVKANKKIDNKKHYFFSCQKLASDYMDNSVEFILKQ